jgi:hypothetical protein
MDIKEIIQLVGEQALTIRELRSMNQALTEEIKRLQDEAQKKEVQNAD